MSSRDLATSQKNDFDVRLVTYSTSHKNLIKSIDNKVIGARRDLVKKHLQNGLLIYFYCKQQIFGRARISSEYFYSEQKIWDDDVYPHRFKLDDLQVLASPISLSSLGLNKVMKDSYGGAWGYKFVMVPRPLPKEVANPIISNFESANKVEVVEFMKLLAERYPERPRAPSASWYR